MEFTLKIIVHFVICKLSVIHSLLVKFVFKNLYIHIYMYEGFFPL